jgi:3-methyladenine DNA glycosylase Tag
MTMRSFSEIHAIAAQRKGGADALEALVEKPISREALAAVSEDRWLSAMARSLFEAGFTWKVIDAKWEGFEAAFDGFNPARVAAYHPEDIGRLLADRRIVRNGDKISAVIANAHFLRDIASAHGSASRFFKDWPDSDFVGLLDLLAKKGARLGGLTGPRMLRRVGRASFILSPDVIARLIAEGVVVKAPKAIRRRLALRQRPQR